MSSWIRTGDSEGTKSLLSASITDAGPLRKVWNPAHWTSESLKNLFADSITAPMSQAMRST